MHQCVTGLCVYFQWWICLQLYNTDFNFYCNPVCDYIQETAEKWSLQNKKRQPIVRSVATVKTAQFQVYLFTPFRQTAFPPKIYYKQIYFGSITKGRTLLGQPRHIYAIRSNTVLGRPIQGQLPNHWLCHQNSPPSAGRPLNKGQPCRRVDVLGVGLPAGSCLFQ